MVLCLAALTDTASFIDTSLIDQLIKEGYFKYPIGKEGREMKMVALRLFITVACMFMSPYVLYGQQAEAPIYKDGDWWRVKVEIKRPAGVSIGGPQLGGFSEYLVKIEAGKPRVFGMRGDEPKEVDAPNIVSLALGVPEWRGDLLKFPIGVGHTWSARFPFQLPGLRQQWANAQYEVQSWEDVQTPKGGFEAFKIVMSVPGSPTPQKGAITARVATYYYSPKVKAIVYFREHSPPKSPEALTTSTLVDFNVSQ